VTGRCGRGGALGVRVTAAGTGAIRHLHRCRGCVAIAAVWYRLRSNNLVR